MLVVLMAPPLWGANCGTEPELSCALPPECADGEIIECVDQCAQPIPEGGACDVDPCAGQVCDFGLTCVSGTCRVPGNQGFDWLFCNPGADPCSTGTYCRVFSPRFPPPPNTPPGYSGQCVGFRREGASCDEAWTTVSDGEVCDGGLSCVVDPRDPSRSTCFRGCTDVASDSDCPCPSSDRDVLADCLVNVPEVPAGSAGICATCVQNDDACEAGGWNCCDVRDSCGAGGECCRPDGDNCTPSSDECCGGSACGGDGVCYDCPSRGMAPHPVVGCCEETTGNEDRSGICSAPCRETPGTRCPPRGCPTNPGSWVCTTEGDFCQASESTEVCDGVDNDCAGGIDDITRTGCSGPVLPSEDGYFQGCPDLSLPGASDCREVMTDDGPMVQEVCVVTERYCAWDLLGNAVDASRPGVNDCFRGAGDCSLNGCLAGEWCCSRGDGVPFPVCTAIGTINYQPPGVDDINPWPLDCWLPDAPSTAECPAGAGCVDNDDCGSCASDAGCGWCASAGQCLPGDAEGADGADCGEPGIGWLQDPGLCEAGCMDYFSCDSCARNSECGFCTDTGSGAARCLPGNGVGPSVGSCSGDWIRDERTCS